MQKITMSVHRALSTLKMLDKRISDAIQQDFIYTVKGKSDKINGLTLQEAQEKLKGNFNRVEQLIKNKETLKSAVVKSNSIVTISINGEDITIADAIERKNIIEQKRNFYANLQNQFNRATRLISDNETYDLTAGLEKFIHGLFGSADKKDEASINSVKETYIKENSLKMFDPNNLKKEIEALNKYISDFINEVDYKLSESNATTLIEVEYLDI